jgi:hypothetical protein
MSSSYARWLSEPQLPNTKSVDVQTKNNVLFFRFENPTHSEADRLGFAFDYEDAGLSRMELTPSNTTVGQANAIFAANSMALTTYDTVKGYIQAELTRFKGDHIVFGGKALGGAVATIAALVYALSARNPQPTTLITFDTPRVVNTDLANYVLTVQAATPARVSCHRIVSDFCKQELSGIGINLATLPKISLAADCRRGRTTLADDNTRYINPICAFPHIDTRTLAIYKTLSGPVYLYSGKGDACASSDSWAAAVAVEKSRVTPAMLIAFAKLKA